jgi:hypothetical protein
MYSPLRGHHPFGSAHGPETSRRRDRCFTFLDMNGAVIILAQARRSIENDVFQLNRIP